MYQQVIATAIVMMAFSVIPIFIFIDWGFELTDFIKRKLKSDSDKKIDEHYDAVEFIEMVENDPEWYGEGKVVTASKGVEPIDLH